MTEHTSIDMIVLDLTPRLNQNTKEQLKASSDEDLVNFHLGLGLYIRNHYNLSGIAGHTDDASMAVLKALRDALRASDQVH